MEEVSKNVKVTSHSDEKPRHPKYCAEKERLESFNANWPIPDVKSPEELAKAGFFYSGHKDTVLCFFCGNGQCRWKIQDDPSFEHARDFPKCPFILEEKGEEYVEEVRRKIKNMFATEKSRLSTFGKDWPDSTNKTPKELAKTGFFYCRYSDSFRCFECGMTRKRWHISDEPWYSHAKLNNSCPFVLKVKGQTFIDRVVRVLLPVSNEFTEEEWKRTRNTIQPIYKEYKNEKSRIATFKNWPQPELKTPEELAAVGFFYSGEDDYVRCFSCDGQHFGWLKEEDPWQEHARWYPKCTYLSQIKGKMFIREVIKRLQKLYATEQLREKSFKNWPTTALKTPEELIEAGFYSTGNGDQVQCFECAVWTMNWEVYDDPWFEHAKLNPICKFVRQVKGEIFVRKVGKACSSSAETFLADGQRSEATLRTITYTPIVQAVLNLGFKKSEIEDTLRDHLKFRRSLNLDELSTILLNFLKDSAHVSESLRELEEANNQFRSTKLCSICTNQGSTMIFAPCGHLHYCCPCHINLDKCGYCKAKVLERMPLF